MAIAHTHTDTTGDIGSVSATTTITKPTSSVGTDILIAVFGSDRADGAANVITPPSGWTRIGAQVFLSPSGNNAIALDAFWALGSVAGVGFGNSKTGGQQGWVCAAFSGCDTTTPIDATGTGNSNSSASSLVTNAVTIATANAWHLIAFCDWLGKVGFTATGFTEKHNAASNASAALLYNTTPKSTGSTGTVTVSDSDGTSSGEFMCGLPFALRPASGGSNALSGSIAGVASITGALTRRATLAGSVAGHQTTTGALSTTGGSVGLSATEAGHATFTASLTRSAVLAASLAGIASLTSGLTNTGGSASLAGSLGGRASFVSSATVVGGSAALISALVGQATFIPTLSVSGGTNSLAGSLSDHLTFLASLSTSGNNALVGVLAGQASFTSSLSVSGGSNALSGSIAGVASVQSALSVAGGSASLIGPLAPRSTLSNSLSIAGGTVLVVSSISGRSTLLARLTNTGTASAADIWEPTRVFIGTYRIRPARVL